MDQTGKEIPSLVVMAVKQVEAHISEEDSFKLAPIHAKRICVKEIKRREIK